VFSAGGCLGGCTFDGVEKARAHLWVICGVLGLVFAQRYFFRAFPEAAVDFKVSRSEAQQRAKGLCARPGPKTWTLPVHNHFEVDDNAQKLIWNANSGLQEPIA